MPAESGSVNSLPDSLPTPDFVSAADSAEILQALAALCPGWVVANVRVEHFLAGGYSNRNYRIRYAEQRFVLRLPSSQSTTNFDAELILLERLQSAFELADSTPLQMSLAEIVAAQPQRGWLLTRWVEQPVLASVNDVSAEQLGRYLAALHQRLQPRTAAKLFRETASSVSAKTPEPLIDLIMADMSLLAPASASSLMLRTYLNGLVASVSRAQLCHLDLNPWNLLFDGFNSWVTLDWETLSLAPPLFDLIALSDGYALSQGYNADRCAELAQGCLRTYNRLMQTEYSATELDTLRTLFCWREYAWAAARLQQGSLRNAVVDDVLAQRRVYAGLLANQAERLGIELVGT